MFQDLRERSSSVTTRLLWIRKWWTGQIVIKDDEHWVWEAR
jgi:hypothetical protein